MTLPAISTLTEALSLLTDATGQAWSRAEFFNAVVMHALPMYAATPNTAYPIINSRGAQAKLPLADVGRRHLAALLTPHVSNLAVHEEAETSLIALEPGDAGYLTWPEIKARRAELNRTGHTRDSWNSAWPDWDWSDGELMGSSDVGHFAERIHVTDKSCRVPRETIEELINISAACAPATQKIPACGAMIAMPTGSAQACNVISHKIKRNTLDVPIEKAIHMAGSTDTGPVYLQLRELALAGEAPFTGGTEGSALCYTNDENKSETLTKNALSKRLKKHRRSAAPGNTAT